MKTNKIAIGIPAYKAFSTIEDTLSSINIQSFRDNIIVYICNDNPGDDYTYLSELYKKLDIKYLHNEKNGGPGVARNKCLEAAIADEAFAITFIDADDIFAGPFAIENLINAFKQKPNTIQVQSIFAQPVLINGETKLYPRTDLGHPWVFGRMTLIRFLKDTGINFGTLRAMEDGRFQHCLRLLIEGTNLNIVQTNDISYIWKEGSEHSITRSGADINDGIPVYNYGTCQLGAAACFKQAIEFAASKNPFNGNIVKFATEQMVDKYFTYYECVEKCPKFAEQNWWLSKWFYNNCFKKYCPNVSDEVLESLMMKMLPKLSQFKKMPELTFNQWFEKISTEEFKEEELIEIRRRLPEAILNVEKKTGQLPENPLDILK